MHTATLDRVHAVCPPRRRALLRAVIAYRYVDALMEDRAAAAIGPRIEERPPDWMLPFKRQHGPSAPRVVVALERLKPAGNTLRHNPRPIPKTADQTVGSAQGGSRRRVDSLSRRSTRPGVGQLAA